MKKKKSQSGSHVGIIILEGADASGKTTLAEAIEDYVGEENTLYLHAGMTDNPFQLAMDLSKKAIEASNDRLVIIDRLWLSESAYGNSYRSGSRIKAGYRCFDRLMLKHCALNVLCVPSNIAEHKKAFDKIREERHEEFKDITPVLHFYQDVVKGNLMSHARDYGSQICQFGDYGIRPDVHIYDRFKTLGSKSLKKKVQEILSQLATLREMQFSPALKPEMTNFQGHARFANRIFVGEDLSPRGANWPWPWFWPESMDGSGKYFNDLLQEVGFNEINAVYVNALQTPDVLPGLINFIDYVRTPGKVTYVALGKKAAKRLEELGVSDKMTILRHPQYVKRFTPNDTTYKKELINAINGKLTDQSSVVDKPFIPLA